ncbi:MAG TPA: hypothetical protein VGN17_18870 [Bryobacteraceae bacterium]|jgi:hypothetical protein
MRRICLFLIPVLLAFAQLPQDLPPEVIPQPGQAEPPRRLPNGKLQRDEILKADYQKNVADSAELARLSQEIKLDFDKGDRFLLPLATLKKLDTIDKLTKNIRGRLKRF